MSITEPIPVQESVPPTHIPPAEGTMTTTPVAQTVDVTPDMARDWLTSNHVNRNLKNGRVTQYARAMANGQWTLSNDAICIDTEGTLLNGQHRLNAVIQADVTVPMLVMTGVATEHMRHMDRGVPRSTSDTLRMMGETQTPPLAALLRVIWVYENSTLALMKSTIINDDEIIATLEAHPEARDSVRAAYRNRIDAPPTPVAFVHWLIAQKNGAEVADMFINQVATRANEPLRSPVHAVANRLAEARRERTRPSTVEYAYLLMKGWNYWATGKQVSKMSMTPKAGSEITIPEPVEWSNEDA